jgi:hypothetical protein
MTQCQTCCQIGFCRRWLIVSDDELRNPYFVIDVRNYVHWLGISPGRLLDQLLNSIARVDGDFRNPAGFRVDLNFDVFEPTDKQIDQGRYDTSKETVREWFFYNFGREWSDETQARLHGQGRERFRSIATIVRARYWGDTRVQAWGIRVANDR